MATCTDHDWFAVDRSEKAEVDGAESEAVSLATSSYVAPSFHGTSDHGAAVVVEEATTDNVAVDRHGDVRGVRGRQLGHLVVRGKFAIVGRAEDVGRAPRPVFHVDATIVSPAIATE